MSLIENIQQDFGIVHAHVANTLQHKAYTDFQRVGIPAPRTEEWKYTPIRNRLPETLRMTTADKAVSLDSYPDALAKVISGVRLVFVNGCYSSTLSHIPVQAGVTVKSVGAISDSERATFDSHYHSVIARSQEHFGLLNTAFATDGAYIHIAAQVEAAMPIHILHLLNSAAADTFTQSRTLIVADANATGTVIEEFHNTGGERFYNHATEVICAAHSNVQHYLIQADNRDTTSVNFIGAIQQQGSVFSSYSYTLAGRLVRNNINTYLDGAHAEAHIYALYLGSEDMHQDYHLLAHHAAPHCPSNQIVKGILTDQATGVFNGKIYVEQIAQQTNAFQSSKAILLSDEAAVYSKPQLEIYADDVKCSHGAAIGQVNKEQIFYLMARGIDERAARAILTFAFANEVVQVIPLLPLRAFMEGKLRAVLNIEV